MYIVEVYDGNGHYDSTSATDFNHCLTVVRIMARAYPSKVVRVHNTDHRGQHLRLTNYESYDVDLAIKAARAEVA